VAVRVNCWRRLGENVRACVAKGDPVVVRGKLSVREYEAEGVRRTSTEIEARSVGLDLARVRAKVVPVEAPTSARSVVDVTGLAVVDERSPFPGADEGFVAALATDAMDDGHASEEAALGEEGGSHLDGTVLAS
jgi:single-strand DNA-binding protein